MTKSTPKTFILQIGALIALYISVTSVLILVFSVTNLKFPDELSYYWENESARSAVRNSIAMLIVFFPAFLVFTRLSNQDRREFSQGEYGTLARWFIFASILIGILILLGDLVTLINYFLNGEITQRFLIKVFALLVVVGMTLHYYILDVRGYFKKRTDKAMYFAMGAVVLVIAALAYGYSYIETPAEVRELRLDEQQITDLQNIKWSIDEWYRISEELPSDIDSFYGDQEAPSAPDGRDEYAYKVLDTESYELCATFSQALVERGNTRPKIDVSTEGSILYNNNNWEHEAGAVCFKRAVRADDEVFGY